MRYGWKNKTSHTYMAGQGKDLMVCPRCRHTIKVKVGFSLSEILSRLKKYSNTHSYSRGLEVM